MKNFTVTGASHSESISFEDLELIYEALNDYPQWNDDQDDNPTSRIMSKLYNLLENN